MDFCRASVVPSELIPSVDTPHEVIIVLDALWARDGNFFACLDCTLYVGDRSGVRGCGDLTGNPIVAETVTLSFWRVMYSFHIIASSTATSRPKLYAAEQRSLILLKRWRTLAKRSVPGVGRVVLSVKWRYRRMSLKRSREIFDAIGE